MGIIDKLKNGRKPIREFEADDIELDDEEFIMAEEILGYDSCGSYTKQSCMSDCSSELPTISTLN